jgi:hypothetical protein
MVKIRAFFSCELSLILKVVPVDSNTFLNVFYVLMCWIVHGIDRFMEITDDIIDVSIAGILNYLMVWNGELIGLNICVEITPPLKLSTPLYWMILFDGMVNWLIACVAECGKSSVIRFEHFALKLSVKPYWESFPKFDSLTELALHLLEKMYVDNRLERFLCKGGPGTPSLF